LNHFKNIQTFEKFLNSLGRFRMELDLGRTCKGLEALGIRPNDIPAVQIVGTNGKGSTACFLEVLARSHGLKTGLYTSPHLISVRERIRINNCFLPHDLWLDAANEVLGRCRGLGPTYFEVLTLMAVLIFKQEKVDLAVMEAGLGGRYDATSALTPVVNVFTPVGLDHTLILGNTKEKIAMDKSMAMKKGPVVIAGQEEAVMDVFMSRADNLGAKVYQLQDLFCFDNGQLKSVLMPEMVLKTSDIGLKGFFQLGNAATALLAWKVFAEKKGFVSDHNLCVLALKEAFWPGRVHFVQKDPMVILDGAHNPQGMEALKTALKEMGIHPKTIVFSCLRDKNVEQLIDMVRDFCPENVFIPDIIENPRAMPRQELAALFGKPAVPLDDTAKYLRRLKQEEAPVLVCGSLYLLGEIYAAFPVWMER